MEKLARKPLLEGAEAWFAIPRWQALAPTYNEAVEMVLGVLATKRKFQNRIVGRLGPTYLRQSRALQAGGKDSGRSAAGQRHSGGGRAGRHAASRLLGPPHPRAPWPAMSLALGVFAVACMLLTHPERLSTEDTLMIDCGGDEYSVRGDYTFDRVPLFDYDIAGIEFSIFYEDRSRNLWGTPTGFLYKFG